MSVFGRLDAIVSSDSNLVRKSQLDRVKITNKELFKSILTTRQSHKDNATQFQSVKQGDVYFRGQAMIRTPCLFGAGGGLMAGEGGTAY